MGADIVPIAAFADRRVSLWGVLLGGAEPLLAIARLGAGEPLEVLGGSLDIGPGRPERDDRGRDDQSAAWKASGADWNIALEPESAGAASEAVDASLVLCTVRGVVSLHGATHELDCLGVRLVAAADALQSLRLVAGWLQSDTAFALLALRPNGADGHGQDRIAALLVGEGEGISVFDPRLSTTYGGDGAPRHATIELWVGENEDAELRFKRFAGEAEPSSGRLSADGLTVECHALQGRDADASGPGVYLLAQTVR